MFSEIQNNKAVVEYLIGDQLSDHVSAFLKQTNISPTREKEVYALVDALMSDEIGLADISQLVQTAFGLDVATAARAAEAFVGFVLLPLVSFVPDITSFLKETKSSDYPEYRVRQANRDANKEVQDLMNALNVHLSDVLEKRLKLILVQYLKRERDAEKTVDMLTREPSIGGMGLTPDIAQNIVKSVDTRLASGVRVEGVVYDDEAAPVPATVAPAAPIAAPVAPPVPPKSTAPIFIKTSTVPTTVDDDVSLELPREYDVEERAEVMQEVKALPALEPTVTPIIPPLTPASAPVPASSAVLRPTVAAVAATHALATTIPVVNGEFMTEEERAEVDQHRMPAEEAEKMVEGDINTLSREGQALIEKLWPGIKNTTLTKAAFGPLVESVLRGVRTTTQLGEQLKERYRFTEAQIDPISSSIDTEIANRRNSHRQKHLERQRLLKEAEELERQAKAKEVKDIEEPPKPLEPAKVEVSTPSVHPALHGEQKVTDILYKKRTVGPIDELGTMTPADFRMLASRPQDLADIVIAKVDTIAEDGYEERLKATRAWKQSPTNALYVRLLRDAMMQQKPLPEIIAAERAKGQEVLSPAEIDAVMTINKRLQ